MAPQQMRDTMAVPIISVHWQTPQNHLFFPGVVTRESQSLVRNHRNTDTHSSNTTQVVANVTALT